ncbi:MAG: hypothetical protein U0L49_03345 [Eubacterium sp.]|nr:hypothetical protein [Eubacterium sp.]
MHLFEDRYPTVTLDRAEDRKLALDNPRLFLEAYPWPVIIDEIQKTPNLLDEIRPLNEAIWYYPISLLGM